MAAHAGVAEAATQGFPLLAPAFMTLLALLLFYLAIAQRLRPQFLLPLTAGMILANLPDPGLKYHLKPFLDILHAGLDNGLYPALIFLGWGANADLSSVIAHPRQLFLALVAPLGIFLTLLLAWGGGFNLATAGAISIIGGGEAISTVFLASHLATELVGPLGLLAFLAIGFLPLVQPALIRLLTTPAERMIYMPPMRKVPKSECLGFAVGGLLITGLLVPRAILLTGLFFLGNIIKESGVTDRLARTIAVGMLDVVIVLFSFDLGTRCQAGLLLSLTFIKIIGLGVAALLLVTLIGIMAVKLANLILNQKINPLVGAAALGLVPDAAQMVHLVSRQEDPHNYLYIHALASNLGGLIASTLTAGILWAICGG
ncbi:MAG: sodium ion-translocating decarboxylase subunit beta [Deltaproteobacteria bacterium]|nr:sodium ion-translocating decarboxylase subunit beta [Deltaproteobacteria bacterium]MBW1951969.1 sodium ion-translocating decarboxylase subunit beta [Deltaproteobacteria bacterium]MBW1986745.1 sodium ion-translocating decarboxylase subunit beta [Deltaproteobacteria bacterium]MBW2134272.1 sodium ion-translocating decarboxylase subunit beta [Deltaproteobacteria bacterium]